MHNISKSQNRLFNIILRIDNCLRHTRSSHALFRSCLSHFTYFSAERDCLSQASKNNYRRRHPQNKRQQWQAKAAATTTMPLKRRLVLWAALCVCVGVCVFMYMTERVCGCIDFSIKILPTLVNRFFRSYIIHACVCVCAYVLLHSYVAFFFVFSVSAGGRQRALFA